MTVDLKHLTYEKYLALPEMKARARGADDGDVGPRLDVQIELVEGRMAGGAHAHPLQDDGNTPWSGSWAGGGTAGISKLRGVGLFGAP